jgi:hypothetical protein
MQSFKQYLQESAGHLPSVLVTMELDFHNKLDYEEVLSSIGEFIKDNYHLQYKNVSSKSKKGASTDIIVKIYNVPQSLLESTDFLEDIHDIATDKLEVLDAWAEVECDWPPAYPLKAQHHMLMINVNEPNTSLKGIEKLLIPSEGVSLGINLAKGIESIGVLSLLKIRNLSQITIWPGKESAKINGWLIDNYKPHSSVNLLAAQEALIDNGLKDYAEL